MIPVIGIAIFNQLFKRRRAKWSKHADKTLINTAAKAQLYANE